MLDAKRLEAWTRAAQRAVRSDLPHQLTQRGASIGVPSVSRAGQRHWVQLVDGRVGYCSCEAGAFQRPCTHRAAVAIRLWERQAGVRVTAVKPQAAAWIERYVR